MLEGHSQPNQPDCDEAAPCDEVDGGGDTAAVAEVDEGVGEDVEVSELVDDGEMGATIFAAVAAKYSATYLININVL